MRTAQIAGGLGLVIGWMAGQPLPASGQEKPSADISQTATGDHVEPGFKPIFDGKTLQGWEGDTKVFRVEEGCIVAGNLQEKIPRNEFLCTLQRYRNFELRCEAKLVGQGDNAGVQFRSERIANDHELIGYQCDIGTIGKDPARSIWGALYDESRRRKFLAESTPAKPIELKNDQWHQLRIVAEGNRIQLYVNDQLTADYKESDTKIPDNGIIGLQIHSGPPAEAWYRKLRIKEL
jgi:hypothetical protein